MLRKISLIALVLVCISSFSPLVRADEGGVPKRLYAGWQSEMDERYAEGVLYNVRDAKLTVWHEGYYDETPNGLELELDGMRLPMILVDQAFDLECRSSLSFADLKLSGDWLPWAHAGDTVRLVLRDELHYNCWEFPVYPWTLKVEVHAPGGGIVSRAEFRGQPYRIPR